MKRLYLAAAVMIVVSGIVSGCASRVQFPASLEKLTLAGDLYRPDKSSQVPAVVLLAPCGGVTPHMTDWAIWLRGQGYVALIVDSFSPRGSRSACQGESPREWDAAQDAIAARAYVATLPFVNGERVAVMGWSHGGAAALEASAYHAGRKADVGEKPAFRAAVAFYPSCSALDYQTQTPTLMLLAENDDWTPPEQCVTKGERARQQGLPISWEIYPNALHAFDRPAPPTTYLGHSMAYDGKAAAASRESVRRFLEKYLQENR